MELEDCNIEKAFNVQALEEAQAEGRRAQLDTQVLYRRIDWEKLNWVMALSRYCLIFLPLELPSLASHREFIDLRFRTTLAMHRMRKGLQTTLHPLATSDHDEGKTSGQPDVMDDLLIRQLELAKGDIANCW